MDIDRFKRVLNVGARGAASLALVGVLLAACGDDDDDADADAEMTLTTALTTATAVDTSDATSTESSETATEATGAGTAEETESADMATDTEPDAASTGTEDDDDATGTESDDGTGTGSEGTSTEDEDMTATEDGEEATSTGDEADGVSTAEGAETETDVQSAELGETVEVGDLAITVEGLEDIPSAAALVEPESGQRFVAIEVTIRNSGDDDVTLFDVLSDLRLQDASGGEEFDPDLLANAALLLEGAGIAEPRIESDSEVSGMVGFQVPEDEDDLMLIFETDDGESVKIDLSQAQ
jgi:hypothetical protein